MSHAIEMMKVLLSRLVGEDRAQDTFEYVLIIGVVVVAVILAVATPVGSDLISAVVGAVSAAVIAII